VKLVSILLVGLHNVRLQHVLLEVPHHLVLQTQQVCVFHVKLASSRLAVLLNVILQNVMLVVPH
jgi:hypothetical protein